ncbi:hypothetical protein AX15_007671 [Amanita polypyramis BW_CC]|nr:hypothetical protein AX15_007671 [Amanita polypyramis BW_CC]
MRRFVKAISFKRDKSDASTSDVDPPPAATNIIDVTNKKSRKPSHSLRIKSFIPISSSTQVPVASPPASSPSTPQLSVSSDHLHSSSASSSAGSVDISLQTPVDEHAGATLSTVKNKSWNMWVSNKRPAAAATKDSGRPLSRAWPDPPPISHPSSVSTSSRWTSKGETGVGIEDGISTRSENETSTGTYDQPHSITVHRPLHVSPRQNVRALIENKRLPIPLSYPFASPSIGPIYPRSCNRTAELPRKRSMRYIMFQKRLSQRVDETPSNPVSFRSLVTNRRSMTVDVPASLPSDVTTWPSKTHQFTSFSLGVRRWISRPCFEDTHIEYLSSEEGFVTRRISGTSLGVAAIDYSDILDILAYPDYYTSDTPAARADLTDVTVIPPSTQLNPETSATLQPSPNSNLMSSSIFVRNHVSAVPSPLRNDALSSTFEEKEGNGGSNVLPSPPVRRGVHFAEEDDTLPLHIVRMKRKREEKARFLRSENRRRELEARQTLKVANEERKRRELEQMEREKALQEKKAKEEERKQDSYLEQVAATRLRREANRAGASGGTASAVATTSSLASLRDSDYSSKFREVRHRSGPVYDVPPVSRSASSNPGTPAHSSSGSSRSPSVTGQPTASSGEKRSSIRSASQYLTHPSGDLPFGARNRRDSAASLTHRPPALRNSTYPMWTGGLPVLPVPVMPPYMMPIDPSLTMDTPLLPPVPPFMMQQHSRRSSRQSSPGHSNSSSSRMGTSINSSSERVDQSSRFGHSISPSPSSSRSSGFFTTPSVHRSGVSDAELRRASMPPQVTNNNHVSATRSQPLPSSRSSRGKFQSVSQQQIQLSNPWTALPTQTGRLPIAMPATRQENRVHTPSNGHRQTFIL